MTRSHSRTLQELLDSSVPSSSQGSTQPAQPSTQTIPATAIDGDGPPSAEDPPLALTLEDLRRQDRELDEQVERERLESSIREKRAELARLQKTPPARNTAPRRPPPSHATDDTAPDGSSAALLTPQRGSHFSARTKAPSYKGGAISSLRAYIFDIEQTFSAGRAAGELLQEEERVAYAIRCLEGAPKLRILNYAAGQGIEPTQLPWAEVKDYLLSYHSDPETRTLAAMERLGRIFQGEHESVMDFIDRVEQIEIDLPQQESEASRIGFLLSKFKPDIRFHLTVSGATYTTRSRLISNARRIEEAMKAQRLSRPSARTVETTPTRVDPVPPVATPPTPSKRPLAEDPESPAAREPRPTGACYNCGKPGHYSASCPEPRKPRGSGGRCYTCGQAGHISPDCPNAACRRCNQKGHTAVRCPATGANVARVASGAGEATPRQRLTLRIDVRVNKKWVTLEGLADSGSDENLIRTDVAAALALPESGPTPSLHAVNGSPIATQGTHPLLISMTDSLGTKETQRHSFVAAAFTGPQMILGLPWLEQVDPVILWSRKEWRFPIYRHQLAVGATPAQIQSSRAAAIVTASPTMEYTSGEAPPEEGDAPTVPEAYADYADVFSEEAAGEAPAQAAQEHPIELEPGAQPPWGPLYPLSATELETLRTYLEDAQRKGWIRPSTSPAGAPILFVPKKGGKLRLCVDYRALNQLTRKDRTPLPLISEILDRLSTAAIFTKLDLRDAYHRIRIRSGDEWKTAFRTRYGHFEYLVMPFGLANAPATFQAYINKALVGLVDVICIVYLDDILIYSGKEAEHEQHVRSVLDRLRQWDLYANLEKCTFNTKTVTFLGFVVTPEGISMEPERVAAIAEWPLPSSVRDIQVFLGFTGFYRRFIHHYSIIAMPLTDLLRGNAKGLLILDLSARVAFKRLAIEFTMAPLLRHFDPELPTRMHTDFSGRGVGGVLLQLHGDRWHPIAFRSRKLTPTEARYDTGDGELLAIIDALRSWRHYIAYTKEPVTVLTDHLNLRYLVTKKKLNARQLRWLDDLAAYSLRIEYAPGKSNPADALSRRPDLEPDQSGVSAAQQVLQQRLASQLTTPEDGDRGGRPSEEDGPAGGTTGALLGSSVRMARQAPRRLGWHHNSSAGYPGLVVAGGYRQEGVVEGGGPARQGHSPTSAPVRVAAQELSGHGEAAGCKPLTQEHPRWVGAVTAPETLGPPLIDTIRALQQGDVFVQGGQWARRRPSRSKAGGTLWERDSSGLLRYKGRVYVPQDAAVQRELLQSYHDAEVAGHMGVTQTLKSIQRHYHWNSIRRDVKKYVTTCAVCQRTKARTHRPYGLLAALPQPQQPWEEISMDMVTGLPPSIDPISGKTCNTILVIVDRFSKYALYIPTTTKLTSSGLAELLFHHVIRTYGIPQGIVSDRGSIFTSNFWKELCHQLAVKRRLSTAFHPQTDGQTERQNQRLEHYLRTFCTFNQSDWAQRLSLAQFTYNNSWHSTICKEPAHLLMGYLPRAPTDPPKNHLARTPAAKDRADDMREARKTAARLLLSAHESFKKFYDRKRVDKQYLEGQWVWLSARNIRQRRPSSKLSDKYLGPFRITEVVGNHKLVYKLDLPSTLRIHNVFPISALEPYNSRENPAQEQLKRQADVEADQHYEVDRILGHRGPAKHREFLIRWKGYSSDEDSWEPRDYIDDGPLIHQYEARLKRGGAA